LVGAAVEQQSRVDNTTKANSPSSHRAFVLPASPLLAAANRTAAPAVAMLDYITPRAWPSRLKFRKSWHFWGDRVIAVAAGIAPLSDTASEPTTTPTPTPTTTTRQMQLSPMLTALDQRWLNGDVWVGIVENNTSSNVSVTSSTKVQLAFPSNRSYALSGSDYLQWIWHDASAIVFLASGRNDSVTIRSNERTGDWGTIGAENGTVVGNMFTAHVTHGEPTELRGRTASSSATQNVLNGGGDDSELGGGGYVYAMFPSVGPVSQFSAATRSKGVQIIAHSTSQQVLLLDGITGNKDSAVVSAAFFDEINVVYIAAWALRIQVNGACSCIVHRSTNNRATRDFDEVSNSHDAVLTSRVSLVVTVADPTHSKKELVVGLTPASAPNESFADATNVTFSLPEGEMAGHSVTVEVSLPL
jgi:hypothetical protein